mmetsp:Transcript_101272/g.179949  ORF Transcript_101272/g.179949 Transcript_101272/m.179949 type:complete len:816 (+) Transcript_101272:149-2596(+)
MGACCAGCQRPRTALPEQPLDHRVYSAYRLSRSQHKALETALQGGGQEIARFNKVQDLRGSTSSVPVNSANVGVLGLTELFLWWHSSRVQATQEPSSQAKPSRLSRNGYGSVVMIGYSEIEEVGIICFESGGCAVRILTREQAEAERFEFVIRVLQGPETMSGWTAAIPEDSNEGSDQLHHMLCNALDRALKSYNWAHHFLHCALRQRDLFAHNGSELPELALLPNEQVLQAFPDILNFGASQEDLVGHLIVTDVRVVWALDRDRTTYNVSVPHRAHVPTMSDTQTFGLCMVLHIRQPFMNNAEHSSGMRLGFGVANAKGKDKKERLEMILDFVKDTQSKHFASPNHGVADYTQNQRQYQVDSNVKLLNALSRLDMLSEGSRPPEAMEQSLQGEVCECVICLSQVCDDGPLAYLLAAGKLGWACRHIFHLQCAQGLLSRKCPVCRTSFSEVREMPDIRRSPGAWFDAMDVDRTGDLDMEEVLGALAVVLPIDCDKLERLLRPDVVEERLQNSTTEQPSSRTGSEDSGSDLDEGIGGTIGDKVVAHSAPSNPFSLPSNGLWSQWDKQGTGRITRQAFEDPEGGLLVWILARMKLVHRGQKPRPCLAAAASMETLGRWFDFWDWSQVGFLTRGQIARFIAREFEGRLPALKCLEIVQDVWEKNIEAHIAKPVAPPSGIAESEQVPDEEPGSPTQGSMSSERMLAAYADPWHLREGICSRGDFLDGGLGLALRIRLLDATSERSAAGRHRQMSGDLHNLFSFEEALAMAGDGPGGPSSRLAESLADSASKPWKRAVEAEKSVGIAVTQPTTGRMTAAI